VVFHAGRALNTTANVHSVWCDRFDRANNIFRVQPAGENQESRVSNRSPRSGPIARLTRAASEFGVVRIDEYIAFRERCYLFWLKSRVS
jgi:hypothetical protein